MAVPAAVGIGRAILTGVGVYAVVTDSCAMFIGGLRNSLFLHLANLDLATCPHHIRR